MALELHKFSWGNVLVEYLLSDVDKSCKPTQIIRVGKVSHNLGSMLLAVMASDQDSTGLSGNAVHAAVNAIFSNAETSQASTPLSFLDDVIQTANSIVYQSNKIRSKHDSVSCIVLLVVNNRLYLAKVGNFRVVLKLVNDCEYQLVKTSLPTTQIGDTVHIQLDTKMHAKGDGTSLEEAQAYGNSGVQLQPGDQVTVKFDLMEIGDGTLRLGIAGKKSIYKKVDTTSSDQETRIDAPKDSAAKSAQTEQPSKSIDSQPGDYHSGRIEPIPEKVNKSYTRTKSFIFIIGVITILLVGLGLIGRQVLVFQRELAVINALATIGPQGTFIINPSSLLNANPPPPTIPIDPGKARVEQVGDSGRASYIGADGTAGMLMPGAYIDSGVTLNSSGGSVRVIVGEVQESPSTIMLLPTSSARLSFSDKVVVELTQGRVYIEPGNRGGMVTLPMFGDVAARLLEGGGHMVVSIMSETQVAVLCFKGPCEVRVPIGTDLSWVTVKDGEKRIFDFGSGVLLPGEVMTHAEQWEINVACNYCMYDFIPTPPPTPGNSSDGQTKVTQPPNDKKINQSTPTNNQMPTEAPTEVPTEDTTTEAPTEVTPTEETPTEAPTEVPTELPFEPTP